MNIPESVRIAGVEYRIVDVEYLTQDGKELMGQIDYTATEIRLSKAIGMSHDAKCLTLMHEIAHGIVNNAMLTLDNEEDVVEAFARGMYQLIQDNGHRLFGKGEQFGKEKDA